MIKELNKFEFEEDLKNWPDKVEIPGVLIEGDTDLPNGCRLYWKTNIVGSRYYFSDEIGCGVDVWDTAVVDISTLLAAITEENRMRHFESRHKRIKT